MGTNLSYFLREAVQDFQRKKVHLAVFILCLALLLLFLFLLSAIGLEMGHLAGNLRSEAQITVFIKDDVSDRETKELAQLMGSWPEVLEAHVVSKDEALAGMAEIMSGKEGALSSFAGYNPFLSFIELRVAPEKSGPAAEKARQLKQTDWVRDNREAMARLSQLAGILTTIRYFTVVFVGLVIMIVAAYLVQLGMAARREEMEVYRLLGASESFVAAPFLLEGAFLGLAAGIAAALAGLLLFPVLTNGIRSALPFLPLMPGSQAALRTGPFIILAGFIFGALGSLIALRR